ncbi:hypothetical protein BJ742DRAFT_281484 [Cladochytrium replicatum]|nr:hypothetical protein BJ742DRAFT_281484 [Cladochytrium replicatum]
MYLSLPPSTLYGGQMQKVLRSEAESWHFAIVVDFESTTHELDVEELAEQLETVCKTFTDFIGALFRSIVNLAPNQYRYYHIKDWCYDTRSIQTGTFWIRGTFRQLHPITSVQRIQKLSNRLTCLPRKEIRPWWTRKTIKKQKSTSPNRRRAQSDEEVVSSKKYLRSSTDFFHRILWVNASDYTLGYLDRISVVQEIPFVDFAKYSEDGVEGEEFVPFHWVRHFSRRVMVV